MAQRCQPNKATPTPWRVEEGTDLIWGACNPDDTSSYGMGYAIVEGKKPGWKPYKPEMAEREANAALIIEAVNSYAALKARIEELEAECNRWADASIAENDRRARWRRALEEIANASSIPITLAKAALNAEQTK